VNIYRLQPPYFAKPKQHISTNHSSFLFLNNIPKKKKEATISESEKEEISE
jgi:hypothetical protein